MVIYTINELDKRNKIFQSQILFGKFLDKEIINELVNLFQEDDFGNQDEKIIKYIKDERESRGLDNKNIRIETKSYGQDRNNSTLNLTIYKNNIKFLHLSIHISPDELKPKETGMIHITKNIYKGVAESKNRCALIRVSIPENGSKSLVFSIANGYNTPGIREQNSHEDEIKQEMDVIITVLNKIFNEKNNKFYIGDKDFINIHRKTNNILRNINKRTNYTKRKNIGSTFFQETINMAKFKIFHKNMSKTQRKGETKSKNKTTLRRTTRKIHGK